MLEDISAFQAIIKHKGFTKAAKALGVSTPVITRRLARLESVLDTRLIQRTTRKINLTEAGNLFYLQVNDILQMLETSMKSVQTLTQDVTGTLKVGLPVSISHLYITQALNNFMLQYPELKIEIVNGNHLLDLLESGFDLVIHCGTLPDSSFHYKKIGQWKKNICAAPAYLEKYGIPQTPEELHRYNCLDHYENIQRTWKFQYNGQFKNITIAGNIRVNSSIDLKNLAVHGAGIVYLPSFTVYHELQQGQLISLLEAYQPPAIDIFAVYPTNKFLNKKTQFFLDFINELLQPVVTLGT